MFSLREIEEYQKSWQQSSQLSVASAKNDRFVVHEYDSSDYVLR